MFSNLGPLFKTAFRKTEETDTRQHIKREERDIARRKNDEEEDSRISIDLWEDKQSVSVEALQAFLTNFIQGKTFRKSNPASADTSKNSALKTAQSPPPTTPKNTQTARAVSAYQSIAEKTAPPQSAITENKKSEMIAEADLIESDETRRIFALIEKLEKLKENGVTDLTIEPADSFTESLERAIAKQINRFSI